MGRFGGLNAILDREREESTSVATSVATSIATAVSGAAVAAIAPPAFVVATTDPSPPFSSGTTFTNTGAAGAVQVTLPVAIAGIRFQFYVSTDQALRVDPNGSETISLPATGVPQAAGKYLGCSTIGGYLSIACVVAGHWSVESVVSTWAVEP